MATPDKIITNPAFIYNAKVVSVYDGDTLRCDIDLGLGIWIMNQTIRLYGVDTPELKGPERVKGLQVRDWLRAEVLGQAVILKTYKDRKGKYGRWLADLYIGNTHINASLMAFGYGATY